MIRFVLGMIIMIGSLAILGCPLRMVLRMSAGDLNAWVALIGFRRCNRNIFPEERIQPLDGHMRPMPQVVQYFRF